MIEMVERFWKGFWKNTKIRGTIKKGGYPKSLISWASATYRVVRLAGIEPAAHGLGRMVF
jgi:hypothetical protein